ncbi:Protein of unknown function (DUF2993) [Diaminobutyricimonas aerilata]|uniref:DUF2993 family protein n=1 Tax=Diaminobutyricimonas aerilata TaxID=1162967 RepID=A0A2M9CLG1_9MICO|nr:DUF2993 domain-containing protein [Diaminobutyricimonas aerilata]PJJ72742.1 Protein of unknown function (DUF2993) [Diaminobutyricimonas aerilata]
MSGEQQTVVLEPATPRPRRKRWPIVLSVLLVLIVGGLVAADSLGRHYAQQRLEAEIASRLPEGSGAVDVHIGGFSFLAQYLAGSFDQVILDAPSIAVEGTTASASIVANGVPTDRTTPVRSGTGRLVIDSEALNEVVTPVDAVGGFQLVDGVVRYEGATEFLGLDISFLADLAPSVDDGRILLTPAEVTLTGGGASLRLDQIFPDISRLEVPFCAAELLPRGVVLEDAIIQADALVITVSARDLVLSSDTLSDRGSC